MTRPIRDGQRVLDALCARLWPPVAAAPASRPRRPIGASDATIARARAAKNGARFEPLWAGEWKGRFGSQSEADLALCSLLAFWCDGDADQVDRLLRQSGLYRPKWNREDYRQRTLARACTGGHA